MFPSAIDFIELAGASHELTACGGIGVGSKLEMEFWSLLQAAAMVKEPKLRARREAAIARMNGWSEPEYVARAANTTITYFGALRLRAALLLLWRAALRPSECLALELHQVVVAPSAAEWVIRETFVLRADQAWRRRGAELPIRSDARMALAPYLAFLRSRGLLTNEPNARLFVGSKGQRGALSQGSWSVRRFEDAWRTFQRQCGVPSADVRSLLDLRHDAILDPEATLAEKAKFGRISLKEAKKYMIDDPTGLRAALEKSHREFEAREGRAFASVLVPIREIRISRSRQTLPDGAAAGG